MQRTYPNDSIVSGKVKGGSVRIKGSKDEGVIISTVERFDFNISKYFPVLFYIVKFDDGRKLEFQKSEICIISEKND